ncbi:hypothetical protein FNV43_RR17384 [Rhamnella rubrinervis]|uniref:Uncharacterized protein n=1 Tax=Rhamnella rubrinervis TaxID=2594499 RepID=A0A8K0E3K5_9ROSA|nr:hypothetical protein FNV43_RR17384 [Rhamnella rubrinervis]
MYTRELTLPVAFIDKWILWDHTPAAASGDHRPRILQKWVEAEAYSQLKTKASYALFGRTSYVSAAPRIDRDSGSDSLVRTRIASGNRTTSVVQGDRSLWFMEWAVIPRKLSFRPIASRLPIKREWPSEGHWIASEELRESSADGGIPTVSGQIYNAKVTEVQGGLLLSVPQYTGDEQRLRPRGRPLQGRGRARQGLIATIFRWDGRA